MTNRPIMRDVAYKTSSTNPSFIERLNSALALDRAQKDLEVGIGPAFDNWKPVLEANQKKTLQEMEIRGISPAHSELIERVAAASENNTWEIRNAEYQKELEKQEADKVKFANRKWKTDIEEFENVTDQLSARVY